MNVQRVQRHSPWVQCALQSSVGPASRAEFRDKSMCYIVWLSWLIIMVSCAAFKGLNLSHHLPCPGPKLIHMLVPALRSLDRLKLTSALLAAQ